MVRIRLSRIGVKKKPFYKIVVTDKRNSRNGKFIEKIGFFNPMSISKNNLCFINMERIDFWKKNGATVSKRVKKIIKSFGGK